MSTTEAFGVQTLSLASTTGMETESVRRSGGRIWIAALLTFGLAAGVYYAGPIVAPSFRAPADDLSISASDSEGRMRVTWDRKSPLIENADSARLDVVDGVNQASYPVERSVLQAGSLEYIRHAPDLLLTLTLFHQGSPIHRGIIRSVGGEETRPAIAPQTPVRKRRR